MTQTKVLLKAILFVFCLTNVLHAENTLQPGKDYPALLDAYIRGQAKIYNFNGNVLVAKAGSIIYQKSFGYGNYDTKELLNKNSLFDTGSTAKQFTSRCL